MYDTAGDLLDAFRAGPTIIAALVHGRSTDELRAARGGDENWSVVEVLCHLRDAEERALERARAIADQDAPLIAGYDQDAWARERDYAGDDPHAALDAFRRHRAEHVRVLEALPPEGWRRTGLHEEYGPVSLENHTIHMAAHDAVHAAQIARQLWKA
jgi:hypothetical protein